MATTNTREIKDSTLINVENIGVGDTGYTVDNGSFHIRRTWSKTGVVQQVEFKELKSVLYEAGVRKLFEKYNNQLHRFEDGKLLIKNELAREKLGLNPRGKYTFDTNQINEYLNTTNLAWFEEVLENCPDSVMDNIVTTAIEVGINDMNKIALIKSYSGKDILPIINAKKEEEVGEKTRKSEDVKPKTAESTTRTPSTRAKKS